MSIKNELKKAGDHISEGAKDLGKNVEDLAKHTRDSVKEFFNDPETKDKLKTIENDFRSARDNVKNDIKEAQEQQRKDDAINKVESCINKLRDSSPEEFDNQAGKVSDSLKTINNAPHDAEITVNGDCSVTVGGEL